MKRWKGRWTAIRKREKDDVQPYSAAGEPEEDAEESPVKTEPSAESTEGSDKPTPREAQPSGEELDSSEGIG